MLHAHHRNTAGPTSMPAMIPNSLLTICKQLQALKMFKLLPAEFEQAAYLNLLLTICGYCRCQMLTLNGLWLFLLPNIDTERQLQSIVWPGRHTGYNSTSSGTVDVLLIPMWLVDWHDYSELTDRAKRTVCQCFWLADKQPPSHITESQFLRYCFCHRSGCAVQ